MLLRRRGRIHARVRKGGGRTKGRAVDCFECKLMFISRSHTSALCSGLVGISFSASSGLSSTLRMPSFLSFHETKLNLLDFFLASTTLLTASLWRLVLLTNVTCRRDCKREREVVQRLRRLNCLVVEA